MFLPFTLMTTEVLANGLPSESMNLTSNPLLATLASVAFFSRTVDLIIMLALALVLLSAISAVYLPTAISKSNVAIPLAFVVASYSLPSMVIKSFSPAKTFPSLSFTAITNF